MAGGLGAGVTGLFGANDPAADWGDPWGGDFQYGFNPDDPTNRQATAWQRANQLEGRGDTGEQRYGARPDYGMAMVGQTARADQQQQQQQQQADYLKSVMLGQAGPSLAEQQMKAGSESAIRAQQAAAASARGGGGAFASAQRAAMDQGSQLQQQNVQQTSQLRAQEQMQARSQYGQALEQLRTGTLAQRAQNAQMAQYDAGLQQQQHAINDQYSLGMQGLASDTYEAQLQANLEREKIKAGAIEGNASRNQQNGIMGMALGAAALGAISSDEEAKTGVKPADLPRMPGDDESKKSEDRSGRGLDFLKSMAANSSSGGSSAGSGSDATTGAMVSAVMGMVSDKHSKEEITKLRDERDAYRDILRQYGPLKNPSIRGTFDADMEHSIPGYEPFGAEDYKPAEAKTYLQGYAAGQANVHQRVLQQKPITTGGIMQGALRGAAEGALHPSPPSPPPPVEQGQPVRTAGTAGPYAMSDERTKRGKSELDELVDPLTPYSYRYKHPEQDGEGRRVGIMAQDLEKSEAGRSMVMDTPRGKMVDTRQVALADMALAADHHKRLARLEEALGLRKGDR